MYALVGNWRVGLCEDGPILLLQENTSPAREVGQTVQTRFEGHVCLCEVIAHDGAYVCHS